MFDLMENANRSSVVDHEWEQYVLVSWGKMVLKSIWWSTDMLIFTKRIKPVQKGSDAFCQLKLVMVKETERTCLVTETWRIELRLKSWPSSKGCQQDVFVELRISWSSSLRLKMTCRGVDLHALSWSFFFCSEAEEKLPKLLTLPNAIDSFEWPLGALQYMQSVPPWLQHVHMVSGINCQINAILSQLKGQPLEVILPRNTDYRSVFMPSEPGQKTVDSNRMFIETMENDSISVASFDINVFGLALQELAMGINLKITWDAGDDQNFADECEPLELLEHMEVRHFTLYFAKKRWRPDEYSTSDEARPLNDLSARYM